MCYHFLNKKGMKKVSAPIRLRLLYLLYFFMKGGVQKRWKLALSVTAGILFGGLMWRIRRVSTSTSVILWGDHAQVATPYLDETTA